jgi:predicted nucleic acid-binding protein
MSPIFLIDTNVFSELRKRERCDAGVRSWFAETPDESLFTSVLVMGEIRRGIESLRRRDPVAANNLDLWLGNLERNFVDRILPVDLKIADTWGQLNAVDPLPTIDGLLVATALVHDCILITRNVKDIQRTGVRWFNPFGVQAKIL